MATDSIKNKSTCLVHHMTFTPVSEDLGGCKKTLICLLHLTLPVENYYLIFFDNIWHVLLQDLILNFAVSNNLNIRHCKKKTPAQCTKTKQKIVYSNFLLPFIFMLNGLQSPGSRDSNDTWIARCSQFALVTPNYALTYFELKLMRTQEQ